MSDKTLELDHDTFSFEIIEGVVKETNMWTEARTSGGGGGGLSIDGTGASHHRKVRTEIKNKREFWIEASKGKNKGKEYHFVVNADHISIRKDQPLKILAAHFKNVTEAVLLFNIKEEKLFTNRGKISLTFNESLLLNIALLLGSFIGLFFMHSAFCLLYTSPSPRDGATSRMPSSA